MKPSSKPMFLKILTPHATGASLLRTIVLSVALGAVAVGASGCGSRIATRGNEVSTEQISTLEVGSHDREQIFSMFGSPSSTSSFGDETWYYIFEKDESVAFLEPEVKERTVLALQFDDSGKLANIKTTGLDGAQKVTPVERKTATAGNKLSFIEQMIANIGRFGK
ncbi:MAG: outer membrane protein assembly factor BamE [Rhodospirillaceae bacterium]|nr:outer membrane protein assembly factor BamE [Rhodospirillaceae bacterium]